jgi:hypothetical protein
MHMPSGMQLLVIVLIVLAGEEDGDEVNPTPPEK